MELARAVESLKKTTGWHDIILSRYGEVCLRFKDTEARLISGLDRPNTATGSPKLPHYVLNAKGYEDLPITFQVRMEDHDRVGSFLIYRTVNNQLHSANGLPSFVHIFDNGALLFLCWHWNGVLHNAQGPATINFTHLKSDGINLQDNTPLKPIYIYQGWDNVKMEWYLNGVQAVWPSPSKVTANKGFWIRERRPPYRFAREDGLIHFRSENTNFEYAPPPDVEKSDFNIKMMFLANHVERVEGRELVREAMGPALSWNRFGEHKAIAQNPETAGDLAVFFRQELLSRIDPWQAPFFLDHQDRFIFLNELKSLGYD